MKKLLTALGVAALLAGCASQDKDNNGMGGTSDNGMNGTSQDTMKTDSIHNNGNGANQFNNNASNGTGSDTAPNTATPNPQQQ